MILTQFFGKHKIEIMKLFVVLFAVIAAALAAPQFGFGGGLSGSG